MSESSSRVRRASLAAALSLMLALLMVPALAPPSNAQPVTGSISGTVTLAEGGASIGCTVEVYAPSGALTATVPTDGTGSYLADELLVDDYFVRFVPDDSVHLNQWYNGRSEQDIRTQTVQPDPVVVTDSTTTPDINAVLQRGASLSGRVTSNTGGAVTDCKVHLYRLYWVAHEWGTEEIGEGQDVDGSGNYSFSALESGPYKIWFQPEDGVHAAEWYNNKATEVSSTSVYLTAPNPTTNINAVLAAGGSIRGKVVSSAGYVLAGYPVNLQIYDTDIKQWSPVQMTDNLTDVDGVYSLDRLTPGQYKVQFALPSGNQSHFPEWYNDKPDVDNATILTVKAGQVITKINAELTKASIFRGTVRRDCTHDEHTIAGVKVSAYKLEGTKWNVVAVAETNMVGWYALGGLRAGTYRLKFTPPRTVWKDTWYNSKSSLASATSIKIEAGEELTRDQKLEWSNATPYACYNGSAFNNYAALLTELDLSYEVLYQEDLFDNTGCMLDHFNYVFLNCTHDLRDDADFPALQEFVNDGGYLYLSDFAGRSVLDNNFSGRVTFTSPREQGSIQNVTASVVSSAMRTSLGKQTVKLNYDRGGWVVINGLSAGVTTHIRGNVHTEYLGTLTNKPLLVSFSHGSGKVFYSTFHESAQGDLGKQIVSFYLEQGASRYNWYLAEGCTAGGTETWVVIQNPNELAANASITYMSPTGAKKGPALLLPGKSRTSVQASQTIEDYEVSTRVGSDSPIVVERSMYGNNNTWGTDSIGVVTPATTWYLAEGSTNGGMETWITVQNPNGTDAKVSLTYMTPSGAVTGPSATVKANSRISFFAADTVPQVWDVSTRVTSDKPVVAERSMYGAGRAWGTNSIGATTTSNNWYLAEGCTNGGMETWIVVQNPNGSTANVSFKYMTTDGQKAGPNVKVPANSRMSFSVADTVPNTWDVSTQVTSDKPVIAERSMYGNGRAWGTDSIGVRTPAKTWYLAEGATDGGMETWITVQNPTGSNQKVDLTYMTENAQVKGPSVTIPARSRMSFSVADTVKNNFNVSTVVTGTDLIVVERSMYGNGRAWATNSIGYSPP